MDTKNYYCEYCGEQGELSLCGSCGAPTVKIDEPSPDYEIKAQKIGGITLRDESETCRVLFPQLMHLSVEKFRVDEISPTIWRGVIEGKKPNKDYYWWEKFDSRANAEDFICEIEQLLLREGKRTIDLNSIAEKYQKTQTRDDEVVYPEMELSESVGKSMLLVLPLIIFIGAIFFFLDVLQ